MHSYDTRHANDGHLHYPDLDNAHWPIKVQKIWNSIDSKTRKIKSLHLFKNNMKRNIIEKTAAANLHRGFLFDSF